MSHKQMQCDFDHFEYQMYIFELSIWVIQTKDEFFCICKLRLLQRKMYVYALMQVTQIRVIS